MVIEASGLHLGQFSTYGDKYSGGLGTYTSSHVPIAIYAAKVNKTFFVYGGTTRKDEKHLLIMLSYYDHVKKQCLNLLLYTIRRR
jgi:hypothetical protein